MKFFGKSMRMQVLALAIVVLTVQGIALLSSAGAVQMRSRTKSHSEYTPHFPIIITRRADFISYGFPGNGTPQSPFIIQGLNISYSQGISISNTEAYFVISHCYFDCPSSPADVGPSSSYCIALGGAKNGVVADCWLQGGYSTLYMAGCSNIEIINNTIVGASYEGIGIQSDFNDHLVNNTIVSDAGGVIAWNEYNSRISMNRIYGNFQSGITMHYCYNDTIENNLIGWNWNYNVGGITEPKTNAFDDTNSDLWIGNHYSDYGGVGTYVINGPGNETDKTPAQLTDKTAPQMVSPDTITLPPQARELVCNFTERYPLTYEAKIANEPIVHGYWLDDSVRLPVSLFHGEDVNITIRVVDGAQNAASFTIHVHIQQAGGNALGDLTPVVYTAVAVVGVIAIMIALEFHRREKS